MVSDFQASYLKLDVSKENKDQIKKIINELQQKTIKKKDIKVIKKKLQKSEKITKDVKPEVTLEDRKRIIQKGGGRKREEPEIIETVTYKFAPKIDKEKREDLELLNQEYERRKRFNEEIIAEEEEELERREGVDLLLLSEMELKEDESSSDMNEDLDDLFGKKINETKFREEFDQRIQKKREEEEKRREEFDRLLKVKESFLTDYNKPKEDEYRIGMLKKEEEKKRKSLEESERINKNIKIQLLKEQEQFEKTFVPSFTPSYIGGEIGGNQDIPYHPKPILQSVKIREEENKSKEQSKLVHLKLKMTLNKRKVNKDIKYPLSKKLGAGTFGNVYLSEKEGREPVAVKKISFETVAECNQALDEFQKTQKLNNEHIIRYLDLFIEKTQDDDYFVNLITEFCPDGNLKEYLLSHELKEQDIINFSKQLIDGIHHIHSNNFIHRDLKPENVFLKKHDDRLLLIIGDFGMISTQDSVDMKTVGTYNYIAPEVMRSQKYGSSCDIFSFGCILYMMMTKTEKRFFSLVFEDNFREKLMNDLKNTTNFKLKDMDYQCLMREPEQRPKSSDLLQMVNELI